MLLRLCRPLCIPLSIELELRLVHVSCLRQNFAQAVDLDCMCSGALSKRFEIATTTLDRWQKLFPEADRIFNRSRWCDRINIILGLLNVSC